MRGVIGKKAIEQCVLDGPGVRSGLEGDVLPPFSLEAVTVWSDCSFL